jgi:acetyl-CoA carboxylase beta subunit
LLLLVLELFKEQVKEELPEGFQKSEYVEKTGFVDLIVRA